MTNSLCRIMLPLGLLILLADGPLQAIGQQCRLRLQNNNVGTPDGIPIPSSPPGTGGSPNSSNGNGTSGGSGIPADNSSNTNPSPFVYGTDKIRGVNLGGWFVLEPWITPSIFENTNDDNIVDEYTFGQMQDLSVAQNTLQQHWETWITEDDFKAIQAAGLNHVRIPLGYWSVPMNDSVSVAPYVPGAWPYLLQALNWAKDNSLNVILDLHGAPGSQNGYDNSGQRTNDPVWATDSSNINRTIEILSFISEEIGGMIDVLELLNEPAGYTSSEWATAIRQFWQDGYTAVREVSSSMKIMIGDAFLGVQSWENFLTNPDAQGVLMDYHEYQIFSDEELARTDDEHISFACGLIPTLSNFDQQNLWTILGEWSAASTDCALWLNGRNVGSRWDGTYYSSPGTQVFGSCDGLTGDSANFTEDYKTFLRKYWEVQVDVAENLQGWIWWTWKAENADEWSYQKGLAGGWIPQDPTERLYPGLCNS